VSSAWFFLLGVVLGCLSVLAGVWVARRQRKPNPAQPRVIEHIDLDPDEARAIDPDNPPHYMLYHPRSGVSSMHCTCHGDQIAVGEKVLLWPIPQHPEQGMDVLCARTYGQVSQ
jgi:hypothetical protein